MFAERGPQQFGDIANCAVDIDIARPQRLLAGEGEQVLNQLGAAIGRLVDQRDRLQGLGVAAKIVR
jgi:hypothetical protein